MKNQTILKDCYHCGGKACVRIDLDQNHGGVSETEDEIDIDSDAYLHTYDEKIRKEISTRLENAVFRCESCEHWE